MIHTTEILNRENFNILVVMLLCGGTTLPKSSNAAVLADTPGLTALQSTTGAAIQTVCGGLAPRNQITVNPQTEEQDLFNQCNAIINTGNQIQDDGATGNSLNLDNEQLGSALQNVATEEISTPARISLSTLSGQVAEINTHLAILHKVSQGLGGGAAYDDGGLLSNRLSVFVNGVGGFGEIESTDREDATDFYSAGVVFGVDYRFSDHFVAGLAGGYSHLDSDFQTSIDVAGGGIDADTYHVSVFSAYDLQDFYVDGNFTYGWNDYDLERRVVVLSQNPNSTGGANRVAESSPDGEQYSTGFGFGYNYHHQAITIRPYARLDYSHGNIDSYSENGAFGLNLSVNEQNFESLRTVAGTQLSFVSSHSFGVIIPQINFGWHHEFLNKSRAINARYSADFNNNTLAALTDKPDEDYFTLGFGVSSVLQGGIQLFFNYQSLLGYSNIDSHTFEAGMRIEF
ncbi:MAG: autotransporter outer membrane beta-barrel domain-containing protein [Methylococcales bacterium]